MLDISPLGGLPEVKVIRPQRFMDERGFFSETWNEEAMREAGLDLHFVQDNHSLSRTKGTLRGLHFQSPPFEQAKLVRVVRGSVLDAVVDIRHGSPTFGHHVSTVISVDAWNQILVPVGFAHGFVTLEPDTEVVYKVTNLYSREHDKGVRWNDPELGIDWGVSEAEAVLSEKDRNQPLLKQLDVNFVYTG